MKYCTIQMRRGYVAETGNGGMAFHVIHGGVCYRWPLSERVALSSAAQLTDWVRRRQAERDRAAAAMQRMIGEAADA
jgi:hypothetical protein